MPEDQVQSPSPQPQNGQQNGANVPTPVQAKEPQDKPAERKPAPKKPSNEINGDDVAALLPDELRDIKSNVKDGMVTLPYEAFVARITRAQRSELRKAFGTDNLQDILKMKSEYENLKKEKDAAEQARMSEIERERKEKEKARQELTEWQQKYTKLERQTTAKEAGDMIKSIASKHINMQYAKHVMRDFAEDLLNSYTPAQLEKFTDKHIEHWFKGYVKKNPVYAATPVQPSQPNANPTPETKKPKVQVPMTNGTKAAKPNAPTAGNSPPSVVGGKDVRPGKANSMTKAEYEQLKRSMGITV